jgi:hypothetical protein
MKCRCAQRPPATKNQVHQPLIRVSSVVSLLLVVTACGSSPPQFSLDPRKVDFDHPLPGGRLVDSLTAARAQVAFTLVEPRNLRDPIIFLAGDPSNATAFVYDSPKYGRVVVEESPSDLNRTEFESGIDDMVAMNNEEHVSGMASEVTVRGHPAALVTRLDANILTFWEKGISFHVLVPPNSLSGTDLINVANSL